MEEEISAFARGQMAEVFRVFIDNGFDVCFALETDIYLITLWSAISSSFYGP